MHTNLKTHGGNFKEILINEFSVAKNVSIASGYVGLDVVNSFENEFLRIADNGGISRLLLGLALYEGLSQKKLDALNALNEKLSQFQNSSGIYIANGRRYHGKVYHFHDDITSKIYIGSSNFSSNGIKGNIECTIPVQTDDQKQLLIEFLDDLYSSEYSITINKAKIRVPGKKKIVRKKIEDLWSRLKRYDPSTIDITTLPKFEYPLSRIAEKEKSSLNVYFGKGRENKKTGIITPRPWYEIELIAKRDLNSHKNYPHGDFDAYTDDGYIIPMRTQGTNDKNIRSKDGLQIFGMWLKGKLEKSGALSKFQPVTLDTLEEYGESSLTFYKIEDKKYYMKF